jgi:mRNA interferase MazF
LNKLSVGEVVEIDLDPTKGHEQKKRRPCLVINLHPRLNLVTVFPITDAKNKSGKVFIVIKDLKLAGLSKASVIDTFQIRTLSTDRINKKMGKVSDTEVFDCRKSIALMFEIDEEHLS